MDNSFIFNCPAEYLKQNVVLDFVKALSNVTFHHGVVIVPVNKPVKFKGSVMD
jgi:hypothetical protein